MSTHYHRPILSGIFDVLGALVVIGALVTVVAGLLIEGERYLIVSGALGVVVAIVYFGIAQVIDFLVRSAHHTERLCALLDTSVSRQIHAIEQRLSSGIPLLVRLDKISTAAPSSSGVGGAVYHYAALGREEGPFTAIDIKEFRAADVIR